MGKVRSRLLNPAVIEFSEILSDGSLSGEPSILEMCGIFGKIYFDVKRPVERHVVESACGKLVHRGPDGQGVMCEGNVGFGTRRLAVIDVAGGAQPMSTQDGRLWITYNGEIYNFRELRKQLIALGCRFRTESDTEVILEAYAQWGETCIERLNGMFAFGIWDRKAQRLLLGRDRLGIKPLYYYSGPHGVTFASEMGALVQDSEVPRRISARAVSDYLSLGYILTPKTIYRDVQRLPPGRIMICASGRVRQSSYWDLASRVREGRLTFQERTPAQLREQLGEKLETAVANQMVSDVPVGAFLSGGVDSSAVVHFMTAHSADPVRTFSIGFEEPSYSELEFAGEVASFLRTDHRERIVRPDLEDLLPNLACCTGEPFGDTSFLPTYHVAELARQSVKVVLSGDGGDEIFGGYETYMANRLHRVYQRVPRFVRRWAIEPSVRALPVTFRKVSFDYKARQFVASADLSAEQAHYSWRELFSESKKREWLPQDFLAEVGDYRPSQVFEDYFREMAGADPLARAQYVDVKTWLADDILVKVDRASMAHGVETRVPLLDHELVEFGLSLPAHLKIRGWRKKYLFKEAVTPILPHRVVNRKKSGFNSPVGPWFLGPLRDLYEDAVGRGNGLVPLDRAKLKALLAEHVAGRSDNGYRLWALLMLRLWCHGQGD